MIREDDDSTEITVFVKMSPNAVANKDFQRFLCLRKAHPATIEHISKYESLISTPTCLVVQKSLKDTAAVAVAFRNLVLIMLSFLAFKSGTRT